MDSASAWEDGRKVSRFFLLHLVAVCHWGGDGGLPGREDHEAPPAAAGSGGKRVAGRAGACEGAATGASCGGPARGEGLVLAAESKQ
jgi:hypothetical protein